MGNSPKVNVPGPTPEQTQLAQQQAQALQQQSEIISQQYRTSQLLAPYLYHQLGLTPQMDASGNITGFTQAPQTEAQQLAEQAQTEAYRRLNQYLSGQGPIDPETESQFMREQQSLSQQLSNQFGPGWQSTTPGSQAWNDLLGRQDETRSSVRMGETSNFNAIAMGQSQLGQQNLQNYLANVMGLTGQSGISSAQYGNLSQLLGGAQQPYLAQQQMGLNANIANATQMSPFGSILGAVGGSLLGGFGGGFGRMLGTQIFS